MNEQQRIYKKKASPQQQVQMYDLAKELITEPDKITTSEYMAVYRERYAERDRKVVTEKGERRYVDLNNKQAEEYLLKLGFQLKKLRRHRKHESNGKHDPLVVLKEQVKQVDSDNYVLAMTLRDFLDQWAEAYDHPLAFTALIQRLSSSERVTQGVSTGVLGKA